MTMSATQHRYLVQQIIKYDLIPHPHTESSRETGEMAHIPEDHIAKAAVVKDASTYLIVVVPADNWLKLDYLRHELNRDLAGRVPHQFCRGVFRGREL